MNANPSKGLNLNNFFKTTFFYMNIKKTLMVLVKDGWKDVASLANLPVTITADWNILFLNPKTILQSYDFIWYI